MSKLDLINHVFFDGGVVFFHPRVHLLDLQLGEFMLVVAACFHVGVMLLLLVAAAAACETGSQRKR